MFDFDATKILIVGVLALIFIPPKDLPRVLRQVGQFVGKMRRMASEFQGQFMDAMREADMADIRREAQKLSDSARLDLGLDNMKSLDTHLQDAVAGDPLLPPGTDIETPAPSGPADPAPLAPRAVDGAHRPIEATAPVPHNA